MKSLPLPPDSGYLRKYYFVLWGIFALSLAYLAIELWVNKRFAMVDFEVYYKAGQRISAGENLYRMGALEQGGDGHFRYKYAPTAALFFMPFALLPFKVAAVLYWLLLSGLLVGLMHLLLCEAFPRHQPFPAYRLPLIPFLVALVMGVAFELEIHLGQVNLLLAFAYVFIFILYVNGYKSINIALLWAATLFIKPYALIFLPYFVLQRQWRLLRWFLPALLFWALLPYFYYENTEVWLQQHQAWLEELRIQLASKQDLMQSGNHTVFSVLMRYTPLRWLGISDLPIAKLLYQLTVLGFIAFLIWKAIRRSPLGISIGHILHAALLIGWIPLLAQTDKNAFIFVLPAILVLILYWRQLLFGWKVAAALGFVLMAANIRELWGRSLAARWDDYSLIAIGALLVLSALLALLWRR